jgi:carbon-monoxide dehydrogenase medium subunit
MEGEKIENGTVEKAAQAAAEEAQPISDVRSSAEYRHEMVRVLTKQAIIQSLEQVNQV